jgi:hypothetical protein
MHILYQQCSFREKNITRGLKKEKKISNKTKQESSHREIESNRVKCTQTGEINTISVLGSK